jgi:hypothetical protein
MNEQKTAALGSPFFIRHHIKNDLNRIDEFFFATPSITITAFCNNPLHVFLAR